jgi:hypothetical protein
VQGVTGAAKRSMAQMQAGSLPQQGIQTPTGTQLAAPAAVGGPKVGQTAQTTMGHAAVAAYKQASSPAKQPAPAPGQYQQVQYQQQTVGNGQAQYTQGAAAAAVGQYQQPIPQLVMPQSGHYAPMLQQQHRPQQPLPYQQVAHAPGASLQHVQQGHANSMGIQQQAEQYSQMGQAVAQYAQYDASQAYQAAQHGQGYVVQQGATCAVFAVLCWHASVCGRCQLHGGVPLLHSSPPAWGTSRSEHLDLEIIGLPCQEPRKQASSHVDGTATVLFPHLLRHLAELHDQLHCCACCNEMRLACAAPSHVGAYRRPVAGRRQQCSFPHHMHQVLAPCCDPARRRQR